MTQHLTAEALRKDFLAVFGQEADQTFFSPGRINLIGSILTITVGMFFQLPFHSELMELLVSVMTKYCVSTPLTLRIRASSKFL